MRRLELANYTNRLRNEEMEEEDVDYDVKNSLAEILLSRTLNLSGVELLTNDDLARKILAEDGHILLETAEWDSVCHAVNTVRGLGRPDVELVRRILGAPEVEVEEKKPPEEQNQ